MTQKMNKFFSGRKALKITGMVVGGILLAGLLSFLFGWIIMLLWNWLMPSIFGLATITYWQGYGIFFLAKIIFGFGGSHNNENSSHKDKKCKDGTIRGEISKEIKKEIKKEFDKEFNNDSNDDKYEDWWETKGKASFEDYMNNKNEAEKTEENTKEV